MDPLTIQSLNNIHQQVVANDIHIPLNFLRRVWDGPYNPEKHLFTNDKEGRQISVWLLDSKTWGLIGSGYCRWMLLDPYHEALYWIHMTILIKQSHEWTHASLEFKTWLQNKQGIAIETGTNAIPPKQEIYPKDLFLPNTNDIVSPMRDSPEPIRKKYKRGSKFR